MKRTALRFFAVLLGMAVLLPFLPVSAVPDPVLTEATSGAVCNASRQEVLYALNGSLPVYPAATVKVMTALIALEHFRDAPDTPVHVTLEATKVGGNTAGFKTGEEIAARDMIGALVVGCANDAAYALALAVSGSVSAFVDKMNETAGQYGMTGTFYTNPTGLHDDKMVTTALDALTLGMKAARDPDFMSLCGLSSYTVPKNYHSAPRTLSNRNYLVSTRIVSYYYDPDITGMNYGSTYEAGGCLLASTVWEGEVYVAAVFGAPTGQKLLTAAYEYEDDNGKTVSVPASYRSDLTAFSEGEKLLGWAEKSFTYFTVLSPEVPAGSLPISLGKGKDQVPVFPKEEMVLYLPSDADLTKEVKRELIFDKTPLSAPVYEGEEVGIVRVSCGGRLVGEITLVTRSAVERSFLDSVLDRAKAVAQDRNVWKWALLIAAVLFVSVFISAAARFRVREKAAMRRREEREAREREAARERYDQINRTGKGKQ